jgi:hypothetical protein
LAEQRSDLQFLETISDPLIIIFQEVLPDVFQEMEMADKIRFAREDLFDGHENPFAHVMDQGDRVSILFFDLLEKRDKQIPLLGRQFDIIKDELGNPVQP